MANLMGYRMTVKPIRRYNEAIISLGARSFE